MVKEVDVEKITEIIYEATRLEAIWSNRGIVPEVWAERDEVFRKQMIDIVRQYLTMEKLPTPEEAHNSWMESYFKMGWKYGKKRDPVLKTHPDLVSYNKLPKDERDKDAVFLALVWVVRAIVKAEIQKEEWKKKLLEKLSNNPYPEDIFIPLTKQDWKKLAKLIQNEMGFSLDRVSGDLMRRGWNNCFDEIKKIVKEI